jgi:hypothetical protein
VASASIECHHSGWGSVPAAGRTATPAARPHPSATCGGVGLGATFEIGDAVPLSWTIAVAGVPTDGTVTLTVTRPDGTTTSPAVTHGVTGSYSSAFTATLNGTYTVRWVSTGAVVASDTDTVEVGTTYVSLPTLKQSLDIDADDATLDELLRRAIEAASQAIDDYTGTTFGVAAGTSARVYRTNNPYAVWTDPFVDTAGLVVEYGTDGTFPSAVATGDVVTWPDNAAARGRAVLRLDIPTGVLPIRNPRPTVRVTARWGWPTVPAPVAEAALLKAARLYRRKDSPEGIGGNADYGTVRFDVHEDGDVLRLLSPYCSGAGGVA